MKIAKIKKIIAFTLIALLLPLSKIKAIACETASDEDSQKCVYTGRYTETYGEQPYYYDLQVVVYSEQGSDIQYEETYAGCEGCQRDPSRPFHSIMNINRSRYFKNSMFYCPKEIYFVDGNSYSSYESYHPNEGAKYTTLNLSSCALLDGRDSDDDGGVPDPEFSSSISTDCGIFDANSELGAYLKSIYGVIKYAALLILIGLSIADFVKAITSGKDDAIKKAAQNMMKRAILCGILFVLPLLVDFILRLAGYECSGIVGW